MAADKKIFADLTDNDIGKCIEEKDAANTKRSTDNSVRLFRKYLLEKGKGADFESMEISELEANLSRFYAEARSEQGTLYKKSSLQTIRHGLSRHLTNTKGIDIIRGLEFKNSNKVFLAVSKDLKRQGFGGMEHYPPLEEADLRKMYAQFDLTDPKQLQWRVFCDVMIYFGRRGRENLRDLKITDFACKRDGEGKMFIYLVKDEVTKNHQNDPNTASGRMYELQGSNGGHSGNNNGVTDSTWTHAKNCWSYEESKEVKLYGPKWMQSMEKKMSTYNKSCCNFYKRACWGWENNNILTDKDGSLDEFTLVGRKVMKEIKDQFDRGNVSGLAELKAEAFYKSCMATHRQDRDSIISQFKQLVKKANTRDLTKLLSTVHSYNVWPLFKVTSRPDPRDVSVNILTLFIGDSPFKNLRGKETIRKISDSLFDKINDSPQITDRQIDSIETDEKLSKAVSDIKDMLNSEHSYEYDEMKRRKRRHVGSSTDIDEEELSSSSITRILKLHIAINTLILKYFFGLSDVSYRNPYCYNIFSDCKTKSEARQAADDLLDIELQLIKAQTKFNQTEYGKAQLYDRLTLGELQSGCSMINWRLYFKDIFGEEISTTQKFIVYKKKNLMSSCDAVALNMTHNLSFRRYILVSLIKTSINYFDVGLLLDEDEWEGRSKTKDRWFTCMAFTQKFLGLATSSVFVRNSPSKDQISQVQEILKYLKKAFREKILQKPWLDKTTINAAVKKLDNMVDKVGYPKYIMNQTFRDTYYDQLFIASNYYNNVMFSQKFSVKQIWKDLTSPADRNKWGMVPSEVNAMHNALHNDMTVTLAIMAPPFYDPDRPISLNFGSLGAIIGHELTHAFGTQLGQFYDYEGARKAWMTRSSEKALVERAKCFIKQYDDYTIKGYEISANKTLDENIADNGGLRAAYQAYLLWKKDNLELNKKFYQIFTQNHFKEDELFFLSFAQMYCSKYSDTAAKYEVTESHSPGPLRVKGTLSNMAEFSSTFQCSKDQTYGREPKCQVW